MKVLIDTNVILDYALIRQPFYDLADRIFVLVEQKQIEGYICASTKKLTKKLKLKDFNPQEVKEDYL